MLLIKTLQKLVGVKWFDTFVRKLQGYLKEIMAHAQTYIRFREAGLVSDSLEEHLSAVLGYNEALLAEATSGPTDIEITDTFQMRPPMNQDYVPMSTVKKVYSHIAPREGHEADLQRMEKRGKDIAQPKNTNRKVILDDGGVIYIGDKTFDQWIEQVESLSTPTEIEKARNWYYESSQAFQSYFGKDWDIYYAAWLAAQQAESPTGGLKNALLAAEETWAQVAYRETTLEGKPKKAGLA